MQVILLERIAKTGDLGAVVNVKSGFARNFLIPQGKAKPATKINIEAFEKIRAELESKESNSIEKAQRIKERLDGLNITISANASEDGKLFGSVGPNEIVEELEKQEFSVEKRNVDLPRAIRNLGEYSASIILWSEISATINIIVVANTEN